MQKALVQALTFLSVVVAQALPVEASQQNPASSNQLTPRGLQTADVCSLVGARIQCESTFQLEAATSSGGSVDVAFQVSCDVTPPAVFDFRAANNCACQALVTMPNAVAKQCSCTVCPTGLQPVSVDCSSAASSSIPAAASTASVLVLDDAGASSNHSLAPVQDECTVWDCNGVCNGLCGCDDNTTTSCTPCASVMLPPTNSSQELSAVAAPTFTPVSEAPSFVGAATTEVAEEVQQQPSLVPSTIPFVSPSEETVETVPLYIAFNSATDEEPRETEFEVLQDYAMQFFDEYLVEEYATRYPDKFVRLEMTLNSTEHKAGMVPEPHFNVYAAFSPVIAVFDVCREGAQECYHSPPHPDILLLDLQKAVKTEKFLEGLRALNITIFGIASEAVLHPVFNLEPFRPTEACISGNQVVAVNETTTVFMNQSTAEATLLCQQGNNGSYAADFYKSSWLSVNGTGDILTASTCGSSVEAMVSVYSSCLDTEGCVGTLDEEDPYSYAEVCQDHCLATSTAACADGSLGSTVSWNSTAGQMYQLQIWQNRRSWGLWHQRSYFPLPCDGEATLKVTSSLQDAVLGLGSESFIATLKTEPDQSNITSLDEIQQPAARQEQLWRIGSHGHPFIGNNGTTISGSTNATPSLMYSELNDFCTVDLSAQTPGTWFGVKDIEGDHVVCLSNNGTGIMENATISVVGGLFYKGGLYTSVSQFADDAGGFADGCIPSAVPFEDPRCDVAVKFHATSIHGILVQTDVPSTFNISVFEAADECEVASNVNTSSLTPTPSPFRTVTSAPTSSPSVPSSTVLLPSAFGENSAQGSTSTPSGTSSSSGSSCWSIGGLVVSFLASLFLNLQS